MTTIDAVITSFNQREFVREAVESVLAQTAQLGTIFVVDDGSNDPDSMATLATLEREYAQVSVIRQENAGVSAARNAGLNASTADYVLVLDGDDKLAPTFIAQTAKQLEEKPEAKAASSWLRMFGVAHALVQPRGGDVTQFLTANSSPACVLLRHTAYEQTTGYDESMRAGFEDWDFFLSLLSTGGTIEIVPEELVHYRTSPVSANITSMNSRTTLYEQLLDKHADLFARHWRTALVESEQRSTQRLLQWEDLARRAVPQPDLEHATYGDGGMASVVRLASARLGSASL